MKTKTFFLTFCFLFIQLTYAQTYQETMHSLIAQTTDTTCPVETMHSAAAAFQRIGDAESNQWLPYYYASYCYSLLALTHPTQSSYQQQAIALAEKAQSLNGDKSEIDCLHAMIRQADLISNPSEKAMTVIPLIEQSFAQAIQENPNNPRIYLLKGQYLLHTPTAFGGGMAAALPYLKKAEQLYQAAKPAELHPAWGFPLLQKLIESYHSDKQ